MHAICMNWKQSLGKSIFFLSIFTYMHDLSVLNPKISRNWVLKCDKKSCADIQLLQLDFFPKEILTLRIPYQELFLLKHPVDERFFCSTGFSPHPQKLEYVAKSKRRASLKLLPQHFCGAARYSTIDLSTVINSEKMLES